MQPFQKTFSRISFTLALAVCGLAVTPGAQADIRYTTQMQFGGTTTGATPNTVTPDAGTTPAAMTMPGLRKTIFVKDMHERDETDMDMGSIHMHQVELTLCDKHQTVKLDDALKIYTVAPIGVASFGPPPHPGASGHSMPDDKPGVGHVTMTVNVQDLGTEKVAELDSHHYKFSIRTQTTGCIGPDDRTMLMEEWIAPIKAGLNCPERYSALRTVPNENGCQITYEMKGDWEKLRDAQGGMVVRQKIYNGDKVIASTDLRDYSQAALDDSLFTLPTDFKQVSQADFDKAEKDAMMKSMMSSLGDAAKDSANGVKNDVTGSASDAASATGDAANAAANAPGDAANAAAGAAAGDANAATDSANAAANAPGDAANTAADNAAGAAGDATDKATEKVKHKIKIPHLPF